VITPTTSWAAAWLDWLDDALHREVLRLRARYRLREDELHGLYVSDEQVDALLSVGAARPAPPLSPPISGTLADLAAEFQLDRMQIIALVVALAPELDVKYRSVFAYLNDDASRPLPSVDLCARLAQGTSTLSTSASLFANGLLEVLRTPAAPHWGAAGLLPSDDVREFLLGQPAPPVPMAPPAFDPDQHQELLQAARTGRVHVIVAESVIHADAVDAARGLAAALCRPLVEPSPPSAAEPPDRNLRSAAVRARLHRALLLLPRADPATLERLSATSVLTVAVARPDEPWRRDLQAIDHCVLTVAAPDACRRAHLWHSSLRDHRVEATTHEVSAVADLFALGPTQIANAAAAAARDGAHPLTTHARHQSQALLPRFAQRLEPDYRWSDLVLPDPTTRRLRELAAAIRHRHQVFDTWGFRRRAGGVASIRALFSGASGTGKTMSAAVVAAELGLPLCRVDLSAVVSKYIGETEKNLEEVFRAAEASSALLMFDEADALFGKRSAVTDARDRYANIEVAYLLQRLETFEGALILTTNLAANLDDAFARRLQVVIDFPLPGVAARERLWRHALPREAPIGDLIDVAHLARTFSLSGGEIGNVALTAALLASYEHSPIGMEHIVRAIARHRLRQGKLPGAAEFGEYLPLARAEGG